MCRCTGLPNKVDSECTLLYPGNTVYTVLLVIFPYESAHLQTGSELPPFLLMDLFSRDEDCRSSLKFKYDSPKAELNPKPPLA